MNGSVDALVSYIGLVTILSGLLLIHAEKKISSLTMRTAMPGIGVSVLGLGMFISMNVKVSVGFAISYAGIFIVITSIVWRIVHNFKKKPAS